MKVKKGYHFYRGTGYSLCLHAGRTVFLFGNGKRGTLNISLLTRYCKLKIRWFKPL